MVVIKNSVNFSTLKRISHANFGGFGLEKKIRKEQPTPLSQS